MKLVLLGGPGAGKGTQAAKMREYYGVPHISTGEMLREAKAKGTELGKKAAEYIDFGRLLPDDIILGIINEKLRMPGLERGFLFDGFPRTLVQAESFDKMLKEQNWSLDAVVSIDVPDEVVTERLLKRAEIEGRADDNRSTIEKRLKYYYELTDPLKDFYTKKGILKPVNGLGNVEEVFERIKKVLK